MIGMATVDYLYVLDDYPKADSVTRALDHSIVVGGPAARGAITAKRLGGTTRLLATCGTGQHAEVLRAELAAEGVECTLVAYDQPSQHSAVLLARGAATRTILWLPQPMADARTIERVPDVLTGVDVALLDTTDGACWAGRTT
jgi:sulfofructose kinase